MSVVLCNTASSQSSTIGIDVGVTDASSVSSVVEVGVEVADEPPCCRSEGQMH